VDLELDSEPRAARIEPLSEDAARITVLAGAPPHHDKTAAVGAGDSGRVLSARSQSVDLELRSESLARGVESLSEHAIVLAVLAEARPGHDEAAIARPRHRRVALVGVGVDVDLELATQAPGRLGIDGGAGYQQASAGEAGRGSAVLRHASPPP